MVAGVVMNLITAYLLLTFVALMGMPQLVKDQFSIASDTTVVKSNVLVGDIEQNSPADRAGILPEDRLVSISANGATEKITSASQVPKITDKFAGRTVTIEYVRNGEAATTTATLRTDAEVTASQKTDEPKGYLGVYPSEYSLQRSTWSAPIVAAGLIKQFTVLTFQGIGTALSALFQGDTAKASSQVAGPVGIFVILKDGSLLGYQFILLVIAIISLTLAIMNILPIPALDGGRLWLTLVTRGILKKPLSPRREELINASGFLFLMGLIVLITIVDVRRFF
jgi:regulator of sigma E protease